MPSVAAKAWTWLQTNIGRTTLLIGASVLLILNLSLFALGDTVRERVVQFWPRPASVAEVQSTSFAVPQIPDTPLNNSQFGERGNRVSQLAQWAELLVAHPSLNQSVFEDTLVNHFPFLGDGALGSMYLPWRDDGKSGSSQQGFVICTGSGNLNLAAHLIRSLRRVHNSETVIEIAYSGDDDLSPRDRDFLTGLDPGIVFIDLVQRFPAATNDLVGGTWAMKPFALLASSSSRPVLMDADAIFLTSPEGIFDMYPPLRTTGTLFFHDRAARGGQQKRRKWVQTQLEAAGRQPSAYLSTESLFYRAETWWEQDSGVVALDKANVRVFLGLIFATWMNTKVIREEVTYQTFHGDKETYWLAMELAGFEYFFQPWYAGNIGALQEETTKSDDTTKSVEEEQMQICGTHMLHLNLAGETPFWFNGGVYDRKKDTKRGYAELTHYIPGNVNNTRSKWSFPRAISCLKGFGAKVLPEEIGVTWQRIREEAQKVDDMMRNRQ